MVYRDTRQFRWILLVLGIWVAVAGMAEERARPRIGLALGGGGAKGCAHVGVLRVLEELRIPVDYIAGTSMGAVVGGLYASGLSVDELEKQLIQRDWNDMLNDVPARSQQVFRRKMLDRELVTSLELGVTAAGIKLPAGLIAGQKLTFALRELLLPVTNVTDFSQLPIPFKAVAVDIGRGDMVILDHGDLVMALRASMAIPGAFSPVTLDDRLLVDGGVLNNVPADVVRAMGADIVIAVDITTPLMDPSELHSMVDIAIQSLDLLTMLGTTPRLEQADILIRPPVTQYDILDFSAVEEIVLDGEQETRKFSSQFASISLSPGEYQRYRDARKTPDTSMPVIDYVRVEGNQRVDERLIAGHLHACAGEPLDLQQLSQDIARLYGTDDFEVIHFQLERTAPGSTGLLIHIREKPWGPNYLKFGLSLFSNLENESEFSLRGNLDFRQLNSRGAEWLSDIQIGNINRLFTEFYQPLDYNGGMFVAPMISISQERESLFENGREAVRFDIGEFAAGMFIGRTSRFGEIRLGYRFAKSDFKLVTGDVPDPPEQVSAGTVVVSGILDTLDNARLPRSGVLLQANAEVTQTSLGADDNYTKINITGLGVKTYGNTTYLLGGGLGWNPSGDLPFYHEFSMGGLLSLGGYQRDELRGVKYGVIRTGGFRNLSYFITPGILDRLAAGVMLEYGNALTDAMPATFREGIGAVTLFMAADTLIGPMMLGYGIAEHGNRQVYLSLGWSI